MKDPVKTCNLRGINDVGTKSLGIDYSIKCMFYKQPFEMKSRVHTFFSKQSMYLGYLFIDMGRNVNDM